MLLPLRAKLQWEALSRRLEEAHYDYGEALKAGEPLAIQIAREAVQRLAVQRNDLHKKYLLSNGTSCSIRLPEEG